MIATRYSLTLGVLRHHLAKMHLIHDPQAEASIKGFRMCDDAVDEALVIDGRVWVLRNTEGPQKQRRIDEDGTICNVLAGANAARAAS